MLARHLLRRVLIAVPVTIGVTAITFFLMMASIGNYIPGLQIDSTTNAANVEGLRQAMGIDRPLLVQYFDWLGGVVQGDFGTSLVGHGSVAAMIAQTLPNTLLLVGISSIVAALIAIPVGTISAWRRGTKVDHAFSALSVAGFAIPQFWLALVLLLVFSVKFAAWGLPHLPAGGAYTIGDGSFSDRVVHLVLPVIVTASLYVSIWSRYTRSSVIEALANDYVRTAKAKGMPGRRVLFVHAVRNGLLPLVTLIGLHLPALVSGTVVVEVIFNWPGMGRLAYNHALQYDYTTVLGITTLAAVMVVLGNLLADVAYAFLDPRIRHR